MKLTLFVWNSFKLATFKTSDICLCFEKSAKTMMKMHEKDNSGASAWGAWTPSPWGSPASSWTCWPGNCRPSYWTWVKKKGFNWVCFGMLLVEFCYLTIKSLPKHTHLNRYIKSQCNLRVSIVLHDLVQHLLRDLDHSVLPALKGAFQTIYKKKIQCCGSRQFYIGSGSQFIWVISIPFKVVTRFLREDHII